MADADFSIKAIISAQTSQFEKGIKNAQSSINSMSKSIEGVQKLLKSAFSVVGIGMSIKAVADFGKTCVQSASQAQKAFSILDNTVKATGADAWTSTKQLEASSKELSDSTNYSVTEIQKAQSVLLGFTNITGEAFDGASEAVLDMATVMGMNLTSAVQTIGKALDDPITGLDSLRRQGFKFTDEQKAELTQLVKNGKQLEAQKIILDTLATSYGGAAKAGQDSFAKQRHAMENFTDTLGGKLIPIYKVFAENSAKTLNHLTDIISKMDFTPIVNVVSNLSRVFSSAFSTISNYLKDVKNEVTDFISRFNFQPIISILDTLAGVFITVFSKIKSSLKESSNIFNNVKESLIEFSHSETFQKIADTINLIIDALVFLWEEVEKIVGEIRTFIVGKVINIWNKIKELFQNSQNALAESTGDIKFWGDYFYKIFNNCFRVVQDLIYGVSALLKGDWEVAWEYAKLTVLRLADSVATSLETIKTTFKGKMKTMVTIASTVMGVVGGPMGKALQLALKGIEAITTDPLGLVENAGNKIEEMVAETEARIEELTKKPADTALSDLNGVSEAFAGFTSNALGNIQDLTEGTEEATEKQKHYFQSAANAGEKTKNPFKILGEKIQEIAKYAAILVPAFANTCKGIAKGFATAFQTVGKVVSKAVTGVKNAVSKMYSGIKKLTEFSIDDSLDALLKFEDGILTFVFETLPQMPQFLTQVFGSISIMFRTIEKQTGNMGGIFSQMISMITTNLPGLFESAINITTGVFTQLATAVQANAPEIVNAFGSMFFTVGNALPGIIDNLFATVGKLLSELGKYLTSNKEKFENTLKAIIASIINGLREFVKNGGLKNLLDGLLAVQQAIEEAVVDNIDEIAEFISEALPDIMEFLKNSIISASKTLGELAPTLLKSLGELIGAIFAVAFDPDVIESSFGAIRGIISGLIQAIVAFVTKIIPVLIEALVAAPKFIPELISGILSGIVEGFLTADWLGIVEACFNGLIEGFKDLFGIHSPSTLFEGFGENIIEGLKIGLDGFGDTLETVMKPLVTFVDNLTNMQKIGDGIKKMFEGIAEVVKISGKVTVGVMAAIANAIVDIHNTLRDIIKSITTIKVRTPWKTYEIGGVDIGKVDKIDMSQYTAIMDAMDNQSGNNQNEPEALAEARESLRVRAYASGTMSARRGLALVGEAGPELVNFRGGEQVLNNTATQRALNGTNNFNVVFNNTQDTTAFAMMQQLKAYNRQMAINGVL